jgi:hypothetical protein
MSYGLISTIRNILLEDGLATNNIGAGRVAGVGINNPDISNPPQGEPGGEARRKRRIAKRKNPRLFRDRHRDPKAIALKSEELERARFSTDDEVLEGDDVLSATPEDTKARKKPKQNKRVTKLRDGSSIVLSPELPDRPVAEAGHSIDADVRRAIFD